MGTLLWPNKRRDLIELLIEVAQSGSHPDFDVDEVIHFFFDDTDLASDINREVGKFIFAEEVGAIKAFVQGLDEIIYRLGDASPAQYLSSPSWFSIIAKASEALATIERTDGNSENDI